MKSMTNNSFFKILFNTTFVIVLSIVTLNACQDSGGKKPINKAKDGKFRKPGVTPTPTATATATPTKPTATKSSKSSSDSDVADIDVEEYATAKLTLEDTELENLVRLYTELSHSFRDAWSISIKAPKQKPNNIFEFVKIKLESKSLIKKAEDKKVSCTNSVPYIFKQKNSKYDSKALFTFGMYDCAGRTEKEVMKIRFDSADSTYKAVWSYGATTEYIGAGVLEFINGLSPQCSVNWNADEQKIDKLECSDVGKSYEVTGYQNVGRSFKVLNIEGTNKVLKLEWADFGIKGSAEAAEIEGSAKTAEKSVSDKIYICPSTKSKPAAILNCEDYYEKCEDGAESKADPICGVDEQSKSEEVVDAEVKAEAETKAKEEVPKAPQQAPEPVDVTPAAEADENGDSQVNDDKGSSQQAAAEDSESAIAQPIDDPQAVDVGQDQEAEANTNGAAGARLKQ